MKRLYFLRHAKSSWNSNVKSDFDRPLNKRGERDAPLMGGVMREKNINPDLIISSPANRVKTTAKVISEQIGYLKDDIIFNENLYLSSPQTILEVIKNVDDEINSLILVGHNPGFTQIINELSQSNIDNLPTCGFFGIKFDLENWSKIALNRGETLFFDYPKNHIN